jgi:phage baseplate assembly protein W
MNFAFPLQFDRRGRTETVDIERHVRDLIEQILFTAPGERVNRPTFGTGVRQLLFAPNSPELAATTQYLIQGALQQWLGSLVEVQNVSVEAVDSALRIQVDYVLRRTQQSQTEVFTVGGALP